MIVAYTKVCKLKKLMLMLLGSSILYYLLMRIYHHHSMINIMDSETDKYDKTNTIFYNKFQHKNETIVSQNLQNECNPTYALFVIMGAYDWAKLLINRLAKHGFDSTANCANTMRAMRHNNI
eukprot:498894_1